MQLAVLLLGLLLPPIVVEPNDGAPAVPGPTLRERLANRGLEPSLSLVVDTSLPFSGGVDDRLTTRSLLTAGIAIDLATGLGWKGTTFYVEGYSQAGRDASVDVGDVQAFSNIDGPNVALLSELWLEHESDGGELRVKVGKMDANSEFAAVDAAGELIHSSAGYSPTIAFLPTYPDPAVGLTLAARPYDGWTAGVGLFNADENGVVSGRRGLSARFDELFVIAQVERAFDEDWNLGRGRVAIGGWHHTGDLARFDGGVADHTDGAFVVVEHDLTRAEDAGRVDSTVFGQWGLADGDVAPVEGHFGIGLVSAIRFDEETWRTGLYVSHANLSDAAGSGLGGDELAIEIYNEIPIAPGIVLAPDLQLIVDPSGRNDIGDAWVVTLRLIATL